MIKNWSLLVWFRFLCYKRSQSCYKSIFKHDTVHLGSFFCINPANVYIFLSSTDRKLEQSDFDNFRKMKWYHFFLQLQCFKPELTNQKMIIIISKFKLHWAEYKICIIMPKIDMLFALIFVIKGHYTRFQKQTVFKTKTNSE